jgi:hypothetical protein
VTCGEQWFDSATYRGGGGLTVEKKLVSRESDLAALEGGKSMLDLAISLRGKEKK